MDKAFDSVFQREVDALELSKSIEPLYGTQFRYQCLCCGEEVFLAAAESSEKSPHFRHRRGNNDIECERYLGQPGALEHYVSIRKRTMDSIGFCFNIDHMTFEISMTLSDKDISNYAENGGQFSLHTKYNAPAFFSMPINRGNLIPDTGNYYTISEYSNDYYVSFNAESTKTLCENVLKRNSKLNIYRISQSSNHYKRIVSDILYTNYCYLAISENEDNIKELIALQSAEIDGEPFKFFTQGRQFFAVRFVIYSADYSAKIYFQKHEFRVEKSESMDILWPPVFTRDEDVITKSDNVFILPSFELIPHGNIDANGMDVKKVCSDVYELTFNERVTICEKNIQCRIVKDEKTILDSTYEEPEIIHADKYIVPDTYDYFIFDKNGCDRLVAGSKAYLSETDRILGYKNGHVRVIVLATSKKTTDKKELINDIIKYHPQSEPFEPDDFMEIVADEAILLYLENCYRSGQINTVIKKYIKEGLI